MDGCQFGWWCLDKGCGAGARTGETGVACEGCGKRFFARGNKWDWCHKCRKCSRCSGAECAAA